jgi:hypothetical protein
LLATTQFPSVMSPTYMAEVAVTHPSYPQLSVENAGVYVGRSGDAAAARVTARADQVCCSSACISRISACWAVMICWASW